VNRYEYRHGLDLNLEYFSLTSTLTRGVLPYFPGLFAGWREVSRQPKRPPFGRSGHAAGLSIDGKPADYRRGYVLPVGFDLQFLPAVLLGRTTPNSAATFTIGKMVPIIS